MRLEKIEIKKEKEGEKQNWKKLSKKKLLLRKHSCD